MGLIFFFFFLQINEGVNALSQYFESASLHEFEVAYDVHNTTEMKVSFLAVFCSCFRFIIYHFVNIVLCKCAYCIKWWFNMYADLCSEAPYIL